MLNPDSISRRDFLKRAGWSGAGIVGYLMLPALARGHDRYYDPCPHTRSVKRHLHQVFSNLSDHSFTVRQVVDTDGTGTRQFEMTFFLDLSVQIVDPQKIFFNARVTNPLKNRNNEKSGEDHADQYKKPLEVLEIDRIIDNPQHVRMVVDGPISSGSDLIFGEGSLRYSDTILHHIVVHLCNNDTLLAPVKAAAGIKAFVPVRPELLTRALYPSGIDPVRELQSNDPQKVRRRLERFFERVRRYDKKWLPRKMAVTQAKQTLADLDRRIEEALVRFDSYQDFEIFEDVNLEEGFNYRLYAALLATSVIPGSKATEAILNGYNQTGYTARVVTGEAVNGGIAGADIDPSTGRWIITFSPDADFEPLEQLIPTMVHIAFHQNPGTDTTQNSKLKEKIAAAAMTAAYGRIVLATDACKQNTLQTRVNNVRLLWTWNSGKTFGAPGIRKAELYLSPVGHPNVMPASVNDPNQQPIGSYEEILDEVINKDVPDWDSIRGHDVLDGFVSQFTGEDPTAPVRFDFDEDTLNLVDNFGKLFTPHEVFRVLQKLRWDLAGHHEADDEHDDEGEDDDMVLIEPLSGSPGTAFVIADPERDLKADDRVLFVPPGGVLGDGVAASYTFVNKSRIEGVVPQLTTGVTYAIWVVPRNKTRSRNQPILFPVTAAVPQTPTISPINGAPNTRVTVTDSAARIQAGDNLFFLPAIVTTDPLPVAGLNPQVAPDNTSISADVPAMPAGDYTVTVRATPTGPERFAPVSFTITPPAKATVSPTSGPVGTTFIVSDPAGRIQAGDQAFFYLPGGNPSTGTPATGVVVAGATTLNATIPNVPAGVDYLIAVRPNATSPSRFNDLPFTVA